MRQDLQFSCSVDEWYFARTYMELRHVDGKTKAMKREKLKEFIIPLILVVLAFFTQLVIASVNMDQFTSLQATMIKILFLLLVPLTIYLFIKKVKEYQRFKKSLFNPPDLRSSIPLYKIDEEKVAINYYNVDDYLLTFHWKNVYSAELVETEFMRSYHIQDESKEVIFKKKQKMLIEKLAETKRRYPAYSFEEKVIHPDKMSIRIGMRRGLDNTLPIPPSWEENGLAAELIQIFKEKLGHNFIESREPLETIDVGELVIDAFKTSFGQKKQTDNEDEK